MEICVVFYAMLMFAGVVELADTRDLKSLGSDTVPVRARSPAPSGIKGLKYRGVEQLAARRAHNPEVAGSSPAAATKKTADFSLRSAVFYNFFVDVWADDF